MLILKLKYNIYRFVRAGFLIFATRTGQHSESGNVFSSIGYPFVTFLSK